MIYIIIGVFVLLLDIMTKLWAAGELKEIGSLSLIDGVFNLTYVENSGVAFGMLRDRRIIFVTLSVVILIILGVYFYRSKNKSVWLKLGTALIFSGSVGNMIERVSKGYVVDFLDFCLIGFPVFNIADIAVCVGAAALAVHFLLCADNDEPEDTAGKPSEEDIADTEG